MYFLIYFYFYIGYLFDVKINLIKIHNYLTDIKIESDSLYYGFCRFFLVMDTEEPIESLLYLYGYDVGGVSFFVTIIAMLSLNKAGNFNFEFVAVKEKKTFGAILPISIYTMKTRKIIYFYMSLILGYLCEAYYFHVFIIYMLMKYSLFIFYYFEITNHIYPYKRKAGFHKYITEFGPTLVHSFHHAMESIEYSKYAFLIMKLRYQEDPFDIKEGYIKEIKEEVQNYKKYKSYKKKMYYFFIYHARRFYYFKLYCCFYRLMIRMENMMREFIIISYSRGFEDGKENRGLIGIYSGKFDGGEQMGFAFIKKSLAAYVMWRQYGRKNYNFFGKFGVKYTYYQLGGFIAGILEMRYLSTLTNGPVLEKIVKKRYVKKPSYGRFYRFFGRRKRKDFVGDGNEYVIQTNEMRLKYLYMSIIREDIVKKNFGILDEGGNEIEIIGNFDLLEQYKREGGGMFTNPEIDKRVKDPFTTFIGLPEKILGLLDSDTHIHNSTFQKYRFKVYVRRYRDPNVLVLTPEQTKEYLKKLPKDAKKPKINYYKFYSSYDLRYRYGKDYFLKQAEEAKRLKEEEKRKGDNM